MIKSSMGGILSGEDEDWALEIVRSAVEMVLLREEMFCCSWDCRVWSWLSSDWRVWCACCRAVCWDCRGARADAFWVIWVWRVVRRVLWRVERMCCFSGFGGMAGVDMFVAVELGRETSKGESSMMLGWWGLGTGACCWCCCG